MRSISQNPALDNFPLNELYESELGRTIAFRRAFVNITGSITAALMLSQLWYWKDKGSNRDKWIYKTQKEWEEETGLSRSQQETARSILKQRGFVEEKKMGIPCIVYYRVNVNVILDALAYISNEQDSKTNLETNDSEIDQPVCGIPANWNAEFLQTSMEGSYELDCGNPANNFDGKSKSITETTTKNTTKTTQRLSTGSASRAVNYRSASAKNRKKSVNKAPKLIIDALVEVCNLEPNVVTSKKMRELEQTGMAFKDWFDDLTNFDDFPDYKYLADEIKRFTLWWHFQDWRGRNGQTPSPDDLRNEWGRYRSDCEKDQNREWEMIAECMGLSDPN